MMQQHILSFNTTGRGTLDITEEISQLVFQAKLNVGLCHLFLHHTSASIILCENADPVVRQDLEAYMQRLIPDGDKLFKHTAEGPDDMPAHIRATLTPVELSIPITNKKLALGTWQGIYLWEHRLAGYRRKLTVTIWGDKA